MKKHYIALVSAALLLSVPVIASSAGIYDNDAAGVAISLTAAELTGSNQAFTFQPSPNVVTIGDSDASSFVIAAYNESTLQAPGGEAYGMASDVSGIYTMDLSGLADNVVPTITDGETDSAGFGGEGWEAPTAATSAGSGS